MLQRANRHCVTAVCLRMMLLVFLVGLPCAGVVAQTIESVSDLTNPVYELQPDSDEESFETRDSAAQRNTAVGSEPVFSLGPEPLLPPSADADRNEAIRDSDSATTRPAGNSSDEHGTSRSLPANPPPSPEPVFTLGPVPLLPPPEEPEAETPAASDSGVRDNNRKIPAGESVGSSEAVSEAEAARPDATAPVRADQDSVVTGLGNPSPAAQPDRATRSKIIPAQAPATAPSSQTGLQIENDTANERPDFIEAEDQRPVMEQVDVTAKRLPPPKPIGPPETGFSVSSAPPPGFEDLAGAQTTLVDVIYSKRVVVSVMATFDMGMLEFDNPGDVLAAIPDAKEDPALRDALTGPLDANAGALCYSDYDTDCGRLEPEVAAIIFDESKFRAELFIHPDFLETNFLAESMYLPRSDTGAASVHAFSMSASGDRTDRVVNLSANSIVSYRESRLESQYDIDSNDGLSIDTLSLKHDARGWEYVAGAFRSRIQSTAFLTEQNLVGARIATSLNTRTDLSFAEATPLFAYLDQRSRVDILRAGQLLDSRFYEAGNQQLDTSRLPDGAYNVTVRIADDAGQSSESLYFFARNSVLPPKDQPLYFAEAGQLAFTRQGVLPEFTDSFWLRAGTAHRLQDHFGLEGTVSAIGDATLVEGGLVWFRPGLQLQASVLAGDTNGVSLRSLWQRDLFALSADVRTITRQEAVTVDGVDLLPGAYTQANLTASFPLFDGRMLARGRWDKRGSRDYKSLGFNYSRELRRFARSSLNLTVDSSFSSDDNIIRFGVDWRWRKQQRDAIVRSRLQYGSSAGEADVLVNARYNTTLRESDEGVYRASAFVDRDVERSVIGARLNGESARGIGEMEMQYGIDGERTGAAYVANARFGVVSSGNQIAFGGRRSNTSSLIIEIGGNAPESVFEVMIDKQSHGYAHSGTRTIIALQPYETYSVRLVPRGTEFVEFDETLRSVTLYPGNVKTLSFTANRQVVVVGKVVDEEGYVIAHHTFTDLDGFASTDENGWFQIELTQPGPLTLKRGDASVCIIELPIENNAENLIVFDELICYDP